MFKFSRLILVFFSLLFVSNSKAQHFQASDFRRQLSIEFSIIDEKRIEKGVSILNNAFELEREAINKIELLDENEKLKASAPEYKKAVKKLLKASETYREGFMIIYTVYQENCVKFKDTQRKINHYAAGVNKARLYERKGSKAYDRALSIRDLLLMMEKPDLIQYKMAEALELEKLSIRNRGRALQIYQDFPVEYNYGWDDDVTPEQVVAAFSDAAISRPPEDLFVQKKPKETTKEVVSDKEAPIYFYVQIAAHTIKMSDDYIHKNIYAGTLSIAERFEGGWYKYTIGKFDNFNDARALLKSSNVRKAFIVAYQNDNKLTIKQALAKIKANQ